MESVIKRYQHGGLNSKINPMLRRERPRTNKYNKNIKNLNNLMKPGSVVKLYRGITLLNNVPKVLKNPAFTSTSSNFNISKTFGNIVIVFTLPSNIKRYHIKNNHNYESETLIQRNTQFKNFKHVRTNKNGTRIYSAKIELLKPNSPSPKVRRKFNNSNNESSNFGN